MRKLKFIILTAFITFLFLVGCSIKDNDSDKTPDIFSEENRPDATSSPVPNGSDTITPGPGSSNSGGDSNSGDNDRNSANITKPESNLLDNIPAYKSEPYITINNNQPFFSKEELSIDFPKTFSPMDTLSRCGSAMAVISSETLTSAEREPIGSIKPSGWHTVKYPGVIDDNYLYNRCHLLAYGLTGENANELNLITGTRYFNKTGMLKFENMVSNYIYKTGNHVLYRVTPLYKGNDLVASGVVIEAKSIEDMGKGLTFNVFVYNIQPGILIDYLTGESKLDEAYVTPVPTATPLAENITYILNTSSLKFHLPSCDAVKDMKNHNKENFYLGRQEAINKGYTPCKRCNP